MLLSLAGWQLSCCSWGFVRWSPLRSERRLFAVLLWPQHLLSDSVWLLRIVVRIVRFSFFMRCFVQACRGLPLASSFSMHCYMQSYGGLPFAGWGAVWPFRGSDWGEIPVALRG